MNKTISGFIWQSLDRFSVQGIQFIIGIVLARLLTPNDYGIIGIIMVFFVFCDIFVDSGFGRGLIQKTDRTETDSSTVFFFNIFVSIFCILFLWFLAPFVADFYHDEKLILFIRISSFTLFLNALSVVQISHLISSFSFKTLAKANFFSTFLSGILAILLAYYGFGVWALICQYLLRSFTLFVIIWAASRWLPILTFSKKSFLQLYSYSSKIFFGTFVNQIVTNLNNIFIAKQITVSSLGYYTRGQQFPSFIQGALSSVFSNLSLPILSESKSNILDFKLKSRMFIKIVTTINMPIMILLAILAKPLVLLLLTEKWIACVPIVQVYCLIRLFQSNGIINLNCALALGRSDVALKVELIKIPIGLLCLFFTLKYGLYSFVLGQCVLAFINLFIDSYYTGKHLNYNIFSQIKDVTLSIFSGLFAAILSSSFYLIINNNYLQIAVISICFMSIYLTSLYLGKNEELMILINHFRKKSFSK